MNINATANGVMALVHMNNSRIELKRANFCSVYTGIKKFPRAGEGGGATRRGAGAGASIEFAKAAISVERVRAYGKCGGHEPAAPGGMRT